ncbi:MAG: tryptophan-rich sensory protein [Candidatus Pacebacteria bacterium]|nr:tryptophan-rich sensory protein [Candidatus Paceibacterota bacterium]
MLKKILALIAYIAMIVVNFLAVNLPINNRGTGEISDAYTNLFTPAGITFSIWGLIYLLLAIYVIYQFKSKNEGLLKKINILFIITSIANILWIFAWHYDFIGTSLILMLVLLFGLIKIADILRSNDLTKEEKRFIKVPFSVYFGWITVATIANITVFLVSINWGGLGLPDFIWTTVVLIIGAIIGILRMSKDKSVAYGLVLVWAYLGILLKHISADGFNMQYPIIITTVIVCLVLFSFSIGKLVIRNN